jgi:hypothetical protein
MTTVEDIERQQRMRRIAFRLVMWTLLVLLCIAVGWLASRPGHHELQDGPESRLVAPAPPGGILVHAHLLPA